MKGQASLYSYRVTETSKAIAELVSHHSNVFFIGLPETGIKRTISEACKKLKMEKQLEIVDLSLCTREDIKAKLEEKFKRLKDLGAGWLLIENLPIHDDFGLETYRLTEKMRDAYQKTTTLIYRFNTDPGWYGVPRFSREIMYFPLATSEEYPELIDSYENRYEVKIGRANTEKLYDLTGGHPYLTKKIIEAGIVEEDEESIIEKLKSLSDGIISQLPIGEVVRLKNISEEDDEFRDHFYKLGLIKINGEIKSKILKNAIENFRTNLKLEVDGINKKVKLGVYDISNYFSSYELEVFCVLAREKFLSRDQLIEACWGKQKTLVSDAAVDKMISRLRQKLTEIGLPTDIIITNRGRGYQYKYESS